MTATVALLGLVLGVSIWVGGVQALPRTVLGLATVLVSLLLASAQSYPTNLSTLDATAALPARCETTCAKPVVPPALNPVVNGGSVIPDRHRLRPASLTDPLVPGARVRSRFR